MLGDRWVLKVSRPRRKFICGILGLKLRRLRSLHETRAQMVEESRSISRYVERTGDGNATRAGSRGILNCRRASIPSHARPGSVRNSIDGSLMSAARSIAVRGNVRLKLSALSCRWKGRFQVKQGLSGQPSVALLITGFSAGP